MPAMADRQMQRAQLQEQWDSLDDLTARLSRRVRERPNRDVEDGPGTLPDPGVAQELILTRGRLAAVEKERDRLQRRLEATREKLRTARTEMRRDRRQLERLVGVLSPGQQPRAEPSPDRPAVQPTFHVVHDEPEIDFEGAPLPESGPEAQPPAAVAGSEPEPVEQAASAAEARLAETVDELSDAVAQLEGMAAVLTAAEAELSQAAGEPEPAQPEATRPVHWSARALFDRISARWRSRPPG